MTSVVFPSAAKARNTAQEFGKGTCSRMWLFLAAREFAGICKKCKPVCIFEGSSNLRTRFLMFQTGVAQFHAHVHVFHA